MLLASAQETRLQLRIKARLSAFFMLQVGHGFKPCRRKNFGGVLNPALQEKIRQAGGLPSEKFGGLGSCRAEIWRFGGRAPARPR